ncbi:FAD-dependent oxidoreductase [Chachezhania antarctica]|uniref:FAD-dependent oxidoreductase n=1 Tax=Chachezhania antarctica TaxID=2340860 RepID=UPI000EAB5950|nr:FAD-dependent oxidoreductase [Chachezhania antarctica]|tara:strand:- start:7207 stop:8463 length:1257 start_codon:yes stop_codon:yes gene_type:complete
MTDYDVIVAGGGAAGVGAALGAAKAGARVCLVEKYGFLGGAATNAQVLAYCGFFQRGEDPVQVIRGAGEEVLATLDGMGVDRTAYRSPTTGNWIVLLDPERLKLGLDRVLADRGIDVMLHTRISGAVRDGDRISEVTLAGMDGAFQAQAGAYVDATGDANLSLVAGQAMQVGDGEGRLQASTVPIRIGGLPAGLRIDRQKMQAAIAEFNHRSEHKIDRHDAGIYTKVTGTNDFWWLVIDRAMPDLTSASFTKAEQTGREMAHTLVEVLRDTVEGFEGAWLAQTGPQLGIRETRHPAARYDVTHDDVLSGRQSDQGVARAAWPIELHTEAGKPIYEFVGGEGFFHVPFDAIRAEGLENLYYGGRVIGADPHAYGSIRVMGTAFGTGEAAGVAAALTSGAGTAPEVEALQGALIGVGALV